MVFKAKPIAKAGIVALLRLRLVRNSRRAISRPGPWQFTFSGYGECLPNHNNFVEIDKTKLDAWGIPTLKIHCAFGENEFAIRKDMSIAAAEMLSAAGAGFDSAVYGQRSAGLFGSRNGHCAHGPRSEDFRTEFLEPVPRYQKSFYHRWRLYDVFVVRKSFADLYGADGAGMPLCSGANETR